MEDDMDEDLRRAIAASLEDQKVNQIQTQEALRQSRLNYYENRATGTKRKADDEGNLEGPAKARRVSISPPRLEKRPMPSASHQRSSPEESLTKPTKAILTYPDGGLRITRTPGRRNSKNCVNLDDLIQKDDLTSALCFSFFIGGDELYQHLPLSHSSNSVPIYIGRDANMDPGLADACAFAGVACTGKLSNKQLQTAVSTLQRLYQETYGKNYHAFYAWSPGSSHSKIMFLVYQDFARLVITSCNLMDIDTVMGDNHWYIHDLPKRSSRTASLSVFETDFMAHLQALSTPDTFLDSIRGCYDYSKVKVHLVTSVPGVSSGPKAEKHGLLRFRRVVQDLDLDLLEKRKGGNLQLDICAASIGNLSIKWLRGMVDCFLGRETISATIDNGVVPKIRLFYPSVGDVRSAYPEAQQAASNIGCHTRPWEPVPKAIKDIFHHYESKDPGRLFHQKLYLTYDPSDLKALPYFVYVGSANLSQSAWGALEADKKKNESTCDTKLIKTTNFECGVVVPGHLIPGLLEDGTKDWQSGIVPFVQTGEKYDLSKDKPWNDPRWVENRNDE